MRRTALAFALAAALPAAFAQPVPDGLWDYDVRARMIAPMAMPEQRIRHQECGQLPPATEECKFSKFKLMGNTATWEAQCNFEGTKVTGTGRATYSGNTMDGIVTVKGTMEGMPLHFENKTTGKYLGPCPAGKKMK